MFEFYWKVPEAGFEWLKTEVFGAKREEGEFLVERAQVGQLASVRNYRVLDETGFFKTFADVPGTPAGILAFANQYGALGSDARVPVQQPVPNEQNTYYGVDGERLEVWRREIQDMHHAVSLWEAARACDSKYLSRFIRWYGPDGGALNNGVAYLPPAPRAGFAKVTPLASPNYKPELLPLFAKGDLILPARHALHLIANEKIQQHGAQPRLLWDRTHGPLRETVRLVPKSLISALWLQFASAIEGDRKFRQCDECRKWFELTGERRADARFCSGACRFKAYRKRQNEAWRMSKQGISKRKIAKQLGSDLKTVEGWISKKARV